MSVTLHGPVWDQACDALASSCPVMARLIAQAPGERLTSHGEPYLTLARSIVGQQISVKAAAIGARWQPWRTVATWWLWRSLDPLPVAY